MASSSPEIRRYVLIDRDGVINVEIGDYTLSRDQWEWAPGVLEALRLLADAGVGVIVITNQACIAKGLITEDDLAALHAWMIDSIRKAGGDILAIYHCPHQTSDGCSCRKPQPGMVLRAAADYSIDLSRTFFVGDTPRDRETARRAGCRSIVVDNPLNRYPLPDSIDPEPDYRATSLLDAVPIILRETGR